MQDLLRFMRIGVVAEGYRQLVSQLVFGGMFGLELLDRECKHDDGGEMNRAQDLSSIDGLATRPEKLSSPFCC